MSLFSFTFRRELSQKKKFPVQVSAFLIRGSRICMIYNLPGDTKWGLGTSGLRMGDVPSSPIALWSWERCLLLGPELVWAQCLHHLCHFQCLLLHEGRFLKQKKSWQVWPFIKLALRTVFHMSQKEETNFLGTMLGLLDTTFIRSLKLYNNLGSIVPISQMRELKLRDLSICSRSHSYRGTPIPDLSGSKACFSLSPAYRLGFLRRERPYMASASFPQTLKGFCWLWLLTLTPYLLELPSWLLEVSGRYKYFMKRVLFYLT